MKKGHWLTAVLTATAIMSVIGVNGTAVAQAQSPNGISSDRATERHIPHLHPRPPKPPEPPTGCTDIDSAVATTTSPATIKYVSAVCSGQVFVLSVNEGGVNPPTPVGGWQFVGGPTNVVDATVASFDNLLLTTVLTSTGAVFEGRCIATLPLTVPCTFTMLPTPP